MKGTVKIALGFAGLLGSAAAIAAQLTVSAPELPIGSTWSVPGDEPIVYVIDKLGGRNYYAAMISTAFSDGWVVAEREGPEICSYRIIG